MYIYADNKIVRSKEIIIRDTASHQVIFTTLKNDSLYHWLKDELHLPEQVFEDINEENQSIIYEEYGEVKVLISKFLRFDSEEYLFYEEENVAILSFKNLLLVVSQNREILTFLSQKFQKRKKKSKSASYAAYIVLDILIDNLIDLTDTIDDTLEIIENDILDEKILEKKLQRDIYFARRTLNKIKKISSQEADSINKFYNRLPLPEKKALKYEIIDLKEHTLFLVNESRELLDRTGYLLNLHMGMMSNKMNQAMQKLASISLIFLPITFIVGNYGMNFKFMPELDLKYGYAYVTLANIFIAGAIYLWLRKKRWI